MESKNDNRSVFDRLDSIETTLNDRLNSLESTISEIKTNNKPKEKTSVQQNEIKTQIDRRQTLKTFLKTAKKENIWCGTNSDFKKNRFLYILACICLILLGILSATFTSIAYGMYSTFSFLEEIWLILVLIMLKNGIKAESKVSNVWLKNNSCYIFRLDEDGTCLGTNQIKKRFIWLMITACFSAAANIVLAWNFSQGIIAILSTIFEILFIFLSIAIIFINSYFFVSYEMFVLFTGKSMNTLEEVRVVFNTTDNQLMLYEDFEKKFQSILR